MVTLHQNLTKKHAWNKLSMRFSRHLDRRSKLNTIDWGKRFLPHYYFNNSDGSPSMMHLWLSSQLGDIREGRRVVCIGPREGAKSTLLLTSLLRDAVEGTEPYQILVSDTEGQAVSHLNALKEELLDNEHGLDDFHPFAVGEGPVWRENYIQLRNGCVIHALGTGSKIRGRRLRQHRPSKIVLDDPENDEHIESAERRRKTWRWFTRTLMRMGTTSTSVWVVGSAIHREALGMKLLVTPGWEAVRDGAGKRVPFRAIEQWPVNMHMWKKWEDIYCNPDDPDAEEKALQFFEKHSGVMSRGAELSWPGRDTLYGLMCERADFGHSSFNAEKQGNPIDPSTCEWGEDNFNHDDFWFDEWPKDMVIRGGACDPSKGSKSKTGDYCGIAWGGISKNGCVYVDLDLERRSASSIPEVVCQQWQDYPQDITSLESNQFQELLADSFAAEAEHMGLESMRLMLLNNTVNKEVRIRRLGTLLAQKRLRFKRSKGSALCVSQMRDFPNGDHDDGPDTIEMMCRAMFAKLQEGQWGSSSELANEFRVAA